MTWDWIFLIGKEEVRGYLDKSEGLKLVGPDTHPWLMKPQGCQQLLATQCSSEQDD